MNCQSEIAPGLIRPRPIQVDNLTGGTVPRLINHSRTKQIETPFRFHIGMKVAFVGAIGVRSSITHAPTQRETFQRIKGTVGYVAPAYAAIIVVFTFTTE